MKKTTLFSNQTWKHSAKSFAIASLASLLLVSCDKDDDDDYGPKNPPAPSASVLAAAGDSATIIGTINQFRTLLGDPQNTAPNATGGRREVRWDGVPPAFTNNNAFPADFFNTTDPAGPNGRKTGLVYTNATGAFRVDSTDYSEIDASYAGQFDAFSRKRLFANISSTVTGVAFKIPGTATDAVVRGFGVVFSDVDSDNSTYIEFFNGTKSLGTFKVPAHPASGNFSFLGVKFKEAKITSLKITTGNGVMSAGVKDVSDGGNKDLVVMDDFLYDEPTLN